MTTPTERTAEEMLADPAFYESHTAPMLLDLLPDAEPQPSQSVVDQGPFQ